MKNLNIFLCKTRRPTALIFGMYRFLVNLSTLCVQIIPLESKMAPPGGRMFCIGLYRENMKTIFSPETIRPRALIFGM